MEEEERSCSIILKIEIKHTELHRNEVKVLNFLTMLPSDIRTRSLPLFLKAFDDF